MDLESIHFVMDTIKKYGKNPSFNKDKFMTILSNEGIKPSIIYLTTLYTKRCSTLLNIAISTYKEEIFGLQLNEEQEIFLTLKEKNNDKETYHCIPIYIDSDWKSLKRAIENTLDRIKNKECPLCFDILDRELVGCSECRKQYCFDCACKLLESNNGYGICPFCKHNKGYLTDDIEDYRKEYYKYIIESNKAFNKLRNQ